MPTEGQPAASACSKQRVKAVLLIGGLLALTAAQIWYWWGSVNDDAFITFRYSANWVQGKGPVYNAGERVEGYSNFLWMVLMAGSIKLDVDPLLGAKLVSVLALWGTLGAILWFGRQEQGLPWSALAGLLFIGSRDVWFYSLCGLETGFYTLAVTLCVFWYAHSLGRQALPPWTFLGMGLGFAVVALVRLDGALLGGLVALYHLAHRLKARQGFLLGREGLAFLLGFSLLFVPYFVWRYHYYGYLLPNSYYAKTAFGLDQLRTGWSYTASFLKNYGFLTPFFILGLNGPRPLALGAILAGYAGYITAVGGDWMEGFRFYVPMMPLLAVIVAQGARVLASLGEAPSLRWPLRASLGVALALTLGFNLPSSTGRPGGLSQYYDGGLEGFGQWLAENAPPEATLATGFAGIIPCLSGLRTIDMMGLNDRYIAHLGRGLHRNYDSHYVLRQKPDYIFMVSTTDLRTEGFTGWIGETDLFQNPTFRRDYTHVLAFFSPSKGAYLWLFQRKTPAAPASEKGSASG